MSVARTFRVPLALAVVSAVGLVSALVGDGVWDALSWVALGTPIAVVVRYAFAPPRSRGRAGPPGTAPREAAARLPGRDAVL